MGVVRKNMQRHLGIFSTFINMQFTYHTFVSMLYLIGPPCGNKIIRKNVHKEAPVCVFVCACARACVCVHVYVCIHVYVRVQTCACINVYIYRYRYRYAYTCVRAVFRMWGQAWVFE